MMELNGKKRLMIISQTIIIVITLFIFAIIWHKIYWNNYSQNIDQTTGFDSFLNDITSGYNIDVSGHQMFTLVLQTGNCNIVNIGDYKMIDLNDYNGKNIIWKTPSVEDIYNASKDYQGSSRIVNVQGYIEEAKICLVADLNAKDKSLSYNRDNTVYFLVSSKKYGGHVNTYRISRNRVTGDGIFKSQDSPIRYMFSLENLYVANQNYDKQGQSIINPIDQLNKGGNQLIASYVNSYKWGRINDIKLFYKCDDCIIKTLNY